MNPVENYRKKLLNKSINVEKPLRIAYCKEVNQKDRHTDRKRRTNDIK